MEAIGIYMLLKTMRSPRSECRWRSNLRTLRWCPPTLNIREKGEKQQGDQKEHLGRQPGMCGALKVNGDPAPRKRE